MRSAAAQVRRGELAILSRASRWVVQLLGRLDDGGSDDSGGSGGDGGGSADGEYDEEDLSGSEEGAEGAEVEQDPGLLRGAKRARR